MQQDFIQQLIAFIAEAGKATYAGNMKPVKRNDERILTYKNGDFRYEDRYSGFFRSFGREKVWYKKQLVWTQAYGGAMKPDLLRDVNFATETFNFLKQALSKKESDFQPRGPLDLKDGHWHYASLTTGDVNNFYGQETITLKNIPVFTHRFFGGTYLEKE